MIAISRKFWWLENLLQGPLWKQEIETDCLFVCLFIYLGESAGDVLLAFKDALSVLMLCAPVSIFTSGSSALLGRPRCGLSIWLSLLAIFNTLFWFFFFHEKTDKTRKYSKSAIFVWYENGRRRLLGAQSINGERTSLILNVQLYRRLKLLFRLTWL